jgi:hypothetical protein
MHRRSTNRACRKHLTLSPNNQPALVIKGLQRQIPHWRGLAIARCLDSMNCISSEKFYYNDQPYSANFP